MDQPKVERMLRLMIMMTANNKYTIDDIANKLDMSPRTIYRYVDTFRDAGFVIKKDGPYIKLDKSSPYFKDISQLVHFTEEEAFILKSAIESIDENNLLKQSLKRKLYSVYDYKILAETVVKGKNSKNVTSLVDAIENRKQVILKDYSSAHSNAIKDRLVEPFAFTTNYIQVWAYEPESGENKLFKVSRIQKVEILDNSWEHEAAHREGRIDIFRISSLESYHIKLRMGLRSASLLMEEYPLSEKELRKIKDNEWILETDVSSFEGVGRFVIGLLDDIEIVESKEFRSFVKERIQSFISE